MTVSRSRSGTSRRRRYHFAVQHHEQLMALADNGCDYAAGLLSAFVAASQAAEALTQHHTDEEFVAMTAQL